MKKTIYLIGIAASIMGGITSCTLDAEDYVTKSSENFPATTEDATQALAGIYQNLNQVSATPECSFLYAAMLASDDCLGGGGPNDLHMQSLDMLMNSKQDMTQQFWKDRYQGINRANSLLDGIGNIELAESDKNQIEGEAPNLTTNVVTHPFRIAPLGPSKDGHSVEVVSLSKKLDTSPRNGSL